MCKESFLIESQVVLYGLSLSYTQFFSCLILSLCFFLKKEEKKAKCQLCVPVKWHAYESSTDWQMK